MYNTVKFQKRDPSNSIINIEVGFFRLADEEEAKLKSLEILKSTGIVSDNLEIIDIGFNYYLKLKSQ